MTNNNTPDLSQAEELNFSIEDSGNLGEDMLDDFLEGTESITGSAEGIKPAPTPEEVIAKKQKETEDKNKSKVDAEKEKATKAIEDLNNSLDNELEEEDIDLEPGAEKKKTSPKNTKSPETDDGITSFSESLYKLGLFEKKSEDEEIPSTPEALLEKVNETFQEGAEGMLYNRIDELAETHGAEYHDAFEKLFVKGVSPKEYLAQFEVVQDYKSLDMTQEENQVHVMEAGLRKQGLDEVDIQAEINRLKTNSDLEIVSGRYHKALVKTEEANLKNIETQSAQKAENLKRSKDLYTANLNTYLNKAVKEKEFNGIPVTSELAKKAYDFANTPKWELPNTKEVITDLDRWFIESKKPENHEIRALLSVLITQTFDGWQPGKKLSLDFSKVQKKAISSESSNLFQGLVRNKKQNTLSTVKTAKEEYAF